MTEIQKDTIYRDYHAKVLGYIRTKISSPQDAEDIAADVFLKVYEKLDSFDESRASLSTWIYTITRNTLTDHFRTRRVFEEVPETLTDDFSVEEELCGAELLETLADALESLEERERDILILQSLSEKPKAAMQRNCPMTSFRLSMRRASLRCPVGRSAAILSMHSLMRKTPVPLRTAQTGIRPTGVCGHSKRNTKDLIRSEGKE